MVNKSRINIKELGEFLLEAKRNTYASGEKGKRLSNGGKQFTFIKGLYRYVDTYFEDDPNPFIGQEVVGMTIRDKYAPIEIPIWGMNYYGRLTEEGRKYNQKKLINFLRESLEANENIKKPFRGPAGHLPSRMRIGTEDIAYTNKSVGTILRFKGIEAIRDFIPPTDSYGRILYQLEYHGGII
jgi:hypothetical protein